MLVSPAGNKVWRYVYSMPNRGPRTAYTIGGFPEKSLKEAVEIWKELRDLVRDGIDPNYRRQQKRRELTVEQLAKLYLASDRFKALAKNTRELTERVIDKDIIPVLRHAKAGDVTRAHIRPIMESIIARGSPVMAKRTLERASVMFGWAVDRELIAANPAAGIRLDIKEQARERFLSEDEIRRFWNWLDGPKVTPVTRLALRFALATAQRRGEVVTARWTDIDEPGAVWTIPQEVAKNRQAHRVPLSSLALELLSQAREFSAGSDWVFPSPRDPKQPLNGRSLAVAIRRNRGNMQIPDFTPHDIRRTVATMIASEGAQRDHVKRILNHTDSSVTAIYDRYGYDREKRQLLDSWATKLRIILNGEDAGKVVPMKR